MLVVIRKFWDFMGRETGPFDFMTFLAAHGAVPGISALPVPAERHPFLEAAAVANSLKSERYGFMDLLTETGAVPQPVAAIAPHQINIFAEARHSIAALAADLARGLANDLKIEAYDFMDLLADNGYTPHMPMHAANDNFRPPRLVPPHLGRPRAA